MNGLSGKEGFLFYGGHNERVYQAAPGILGLIEGRRVLERWKPRIVSWLDHSEHFFDHILAEFAGEQSFEPIRREIVEVRELAASLEVKNRVLFQYLEVAARELERTEIVRSRKHRSTAFSAVPSGTMSETVSLGGPWSARWRKGPGVYVDQEMSLPVNWELVPGIENYAGPMRFTRILHLDERARGRQLALRFHGVDYFADIWVNGHCVGGHEGCFAPFEFDISPYVRCGDDNIIRLAVSSPNEPSGGGTGVNSGWDDFAPSSWFPNRKTLVKGTLGHHDAKRGGAWSSLTGQDGNTGGVWNDVELRIHNPIHFPVSAVKMTTLSTTLSRSGSPVARVRFEFRVANASGGPAVATLRINAEPANFEGRSHEVLREIVLSPGITDLSFEEELGPVALWNPSDRGFPHLYSVGCFVEVEGEVQDKVEVETGLRTLLVSPIGESQGPGGAFVVNGAEVFVRGTNLLPTYWLSEYSEDLIEKDFEMLKAAGFNAVLVHNLVAPLSFYKQANRQGFLVVQMFPLQWSYDQSPDFALRAAAQVEEMAELLKNEPAVVSYEVHNEPDMRMAADVDNRPMDFALHAVLRDADPYRWATTFSGGNHAYPGQFYSLRDDNSFETLPGRFLEEEVHGRRISRHHNMPTEFGLQAMPNVALFKELMQEGRVRKVLARIREDPKWVSAGGESWAESAATIHAAKRLLGAGDWDLALETFDWTLLWGLGGLAERIQEIVRLGRLNDSARRELISLKLAELMLDVLHYGAFKGENFWFGLWKPEGSLEGFVESSQNRQYRLHKHAIETFLNAGVTGPLVGFFSFMFRDADWQAPTWGVVDANRQPKKAYRAYIESNQPVRASLPQALRKSVKLPGDSWFRADETDARWREKPWADAELIVTNDSAAGLEKALLSAWLEDQEGSRLPFIQASGAELDACTLRIDLEPSGGFVCFPRLPADMNGDFAFDSLVPEGIPGRCFLKLALTLAGGEVLPLNSYEFHIPDTRFNDLSNMPWDELGQLLNGPEGAQGFHYWGNGVEYQADAGVKGLVSGFQEAEGAGIDLYEVVQGEHLFRHILNEFRTFDPGRVLWNEIWTIRSEIISPSEKTGVLLKYLQVFVDRAEELLPGQRRTQPKLTPVSRNPSNRRRTHRR